VRVPGGNSHYQQVKDFYPRKRSGGSGKLAKRGWSEGEQRQKRLFMGQKNLVFGTHVLPLFNLLIVG
jgi:hypothetical protein